MNLLTFRHEAAWLQAGLELITSLYQANDRDSTVDIALSGGRTPASLYRLLSQETTLPYNQTQFWQVDERYVPSDHPDSNNRMIRETLINDIDDRLMSYTPFRTDLPLEEARANYEEHLNSIQRLDLCVLGIGPDGHTASLFPNTEALEEEDQKVLYTQTNRFAVTNRLTLSFPTIMGSRSLLVLLQGKEKQSIIDHLVNNDVEANDFPAQKLINHPHLHLFYWQG